MAIISSVEIAPWKSSGGSCKMQKRAQQAVISGPFAEASIIFLTSLTTELFSLF